MTFSSLLTLFLAVATGAIIQFRFLGGLVGFSIASSIMNDYLKAHLENTLTSDILADLLQTPKLLETYPPDVKEQILRVFARGYRLQFQVLTGFAAMQFPAAAMMFKRGKQVLAF